MHLKTELSKELIETFIAGEIESLRVIYDETKNYMYRIIYRMVNNKSDTEDLLHDVYEKIYKNRKSYNSKKAGIKTWISKVAINHTLNHLKKKKTQGLYKHMTHMGNNQNELLDDVVLDEKGIKIQQVLQKVNPAFRICLVLKYIEDYSYEETSKILNIKIGTVRSRLSRGKKEFEKIYKQERSEDNEC